MIRKLIKTKSLQLPGKTPPRELPLERFAEKALRKKTLLFIKEHQTDFN